VIGVEIMVKVIALSELPIGSMKNVTVNHIQVAVCNVNGIIYTVSDICTHNSCSLAGEGYLFDDVLTCGCHGAQFDVKTGKVLSLPATVDLKTYKTEVKDGEIFIEI
jgi:nitrite reductase/ring-hydroxylating ferredoxin subunit